MKRILFALIFCVVPLFGQYVDRIDTVTTLPAMADPLDHVVFQSKVYIWANGGWRIARQQLSGLIKVDTLGSEAVVDSTVWAKKYLLDGKQAAGTYLVPNDTNALRSGLDGKASTSHTQAISSITNQADTNAAHITRTEATALLATKTNLAGETQWTTLKVAAVATVAGAAGWNNLADLGFTGTASKTYEIEGNIFVQSATVTVGVNIQFNCAGGTLSGIFMSTASATTYTAKVIATITDSSASVHAGVVNLYYPQNFRGIWVVDGSNRTFAMQWRKEQVTGTMNQTVGQGSYVRYRIIK